MLGGSWNQHTTHTKWYLWRILEYTQAAKQNMEIAFPDHGGVYLDQCTTFAVSNEKVLCYHCIHTRFQLDPTIRTRVVMLRYAYHIVTMASNRIQKLRLWKISRQSPLDLNWMAKKAGRAIPKWKQLTRLLSRLHWAHWSKRSGRYLTVN